MRLEKAPNVEKKYITLIILDGQEEFYLTVAGAGKFKLNSQSIVMSPANKT